MNATTAPWESAIRDALPAGWQLERLERRGDALLVFIATAGGSVGLDARPGPRPESPWQGRHWSLTSRATTLDHASLLAPARALLACLDAEWPAGLPAALPQPGQRRSAPPQHALFWREDRWLRDLERIRPTDRAQETVALLAKVAPAPTPLHLQLYLRGACGQRCQFCTVPLLRAREPQQGKPGLRLVADGPLDWLLHALAARPASLLTLLGDDWAAHPEREALLARLRSENGLRVGLLGPGTALADPHLREEVLRLPQLDHLTITLQGRPDEAPGAALHDRVVGRPGAAAALVTATAALLARGVRPSIAVVLVSDALPGLSGLLAWCAERQLQVALAGFVPDRCGLAEWRPRDHLPQVSVLRAALAGLDARAAATVHRISGVPRCVVPDVLATRWVPDWPSEEADPWVQPASGPCSTCGARQSCLGVPQALAERDGSAGLTAVAAAR